MASTTEKTNKPPSDAFRQQKLAAWQPIMTPLKVVAIFVVIGIVFIPTGTTLLSESNEIFQSTVVYDGDGQSVDCSISKQNQNRICPITFTFDKDVDGPIYVYYELENFYQNHRRYVSSRDPTQLGGESVSESGLKMTCQALYKNGSQTLNPCGLIANSFFTDSFTLNSPNQTLDSSDIAWPSDRFKFKQPNGFRSVVATDPNSPCTTVLPAGCKDYYDAETNTSYYFYYPNDDSVQYLYETYPDQISPLKGVEDQHFKVWMRTAALPTFRKLYGKIDADFKDGDTLTFQVAANYEVDSFSGSKALVITTLGTFGGRNPYLGVAYIVVGSISLMFALLFVLKQVISPRDEAKSSLLSWGGTGGHS